MHVQQLSIALCECVLSSALLLGHRQSLLPGILLAWATRFGDAWLAQRRVERRFCHGVARFPEVVEVNILRATHPEQRRKMATLVVIAAPPEALWCRAEAFRPRAQVATGLFEAPCYGTHSSILSALPRQSTTSRPIARD
jgi:hypothetical protein